MTKPGCCYLLRDPFTDEVRYIGVTTMTLKKRLSAHLSDARKKTGNHRLHWLRAVLNAGGRPSIEPIIWWDEKADPKLWTLVEQHFIREYRRAGHRLTNGCDGGKGSLNATDEVREKIRAARARQVFSAESRAKRIATVRKMMPEVAPRISAALKGKPKSPEHTEKLRAILRERNAKLMTDEVRQKLREAWVRRRARQDAEGAPRPAPWISHALKGKSKSPEHAEKLRAILRERNAKPVSEEVKQKMREKALQAWARRRAESGSGGASSGDH